MQQASEGEVEAPTSPQVVSGDLSSFRYQSKTGETLKEHTLLNSTWSRPRETGKGRRSLKRQKQGSKDVVLPDL
jgi:hypothetical protein